MKNLLSNKNIYYTLKVQGLKQFYLTVGNIFTQSINLPKKQLLIIASVFNDEIQPIVLKNLYYKITGETNYSKIINDLIIDDYLLKKENGFLEFTNKDFRDNLYNSIDDNTLMTLHELCAESYENISNTNVQKPFEQIIYHYTNSGNDEKLKLYLWKAAAAAITVYDFKGANKFYLRLLVLVENDDEKYDLVLKIADVYRHAGEWDVELKFISNYTNKFIDRYKQIRLLIRIANIFRIKSDYHKSLRILYRANDLSKSAYNEELELMIKLEHAKIKLNKGNHKEAYKDFEKLTNTKFEHINDEALKCKGITLAKLGKYEESISIHQHLFEKAEARKDKIKMSAALIDMGEGYMYMGNYDKVDSVFKLAYSLSKRSSGKFDEAACLGNIGTLNFLKRNYIAASKYFYSQLEIFKFLGNRSGIARAYGMIGSCMINAGKYRKALKYLFYQLDMVKNINGKQSEAICLGNIGIVYNFLGNFKQSLIYFKKQLLLDEKYGNLYGIFRTTINTGIQYYNMKQFNKAEKKISLALKIADKIKNKMNLDIAYGYYCAILYENKKYDKAIQIAENAIKFSNETNNDLMLIQSIVFKEKSILQSTESCIQINNSIEEITKYLGILKGKEELALIHFELWKIKTRYGIAAVEDNKKAVQLYKEIYQTSPQFEFKERLKELN